MTTMRYCILEKGASHSMLVQVGGGAWRGRHRLAGAVVEQTRATAEMPGACSQKVSLVWGGGLG